VSEPAAVPPASLSSIVDHADWIEWLAFDGGAPLSWSDYAGEVRRTFSDDEMTEELPVEGSPIESLIDAVAVELESRADACAGAYPFEISSSGIAPRADAMASSYLFMLSLTLFGKDAGAPQSYPERLFEEMSAAAVYVYLGGPSKYVRAEVFGFPRRIPPKGFKAAVGWLCGELREGAPLAAAPEMADMKDGSLDVVAWRWFPDTKPSQLILFGQCATGADWPSKTVALDPEKWCRKWMAPGLTVSPVAAFFVPNLVPPERRRVSSIDAGIIFDRCRIAALLDGHVTSALQSRLVGWVKSVASQASDAA
jgi:hypothetical protein